ncbi:MAG: zinc-ribbon domain-containing protein [Ruminococcaceae bacterium]|nr:zinc-ribbon domain-containing protein [Oscillospiraceae bacterium]
MAFQREQWHSGLTYRQVCETCKTVVQYTDYALDYRPWYADGFVDCPKCGSHLRHDEKYAIKSSGEAAAEGMSGTRAAFCTACGNKFGENDRFCSQCGAKRS